MQKASNHHILFFMFSLAIIGGVFVVSDIHLRDAEFGSLQSVQVLENIMSAVQKNSILGPNCVNKRTANFSCYETYYKYLVAKYDVQTAFDDLKARYLTNNFIKMECHQIARTIGQAAADKYSTISKAFSYGDSFCWSGYYHGVVETIVEKKGNDALFTTLNTVCSDISNKSDKRQYTFEYYNCVHALGHGIMARFKNELFDSLALCDSLSGTWEQSACAGGVFMENITNETHTGNSKYFDKDDLLYPCDSVSDAHKTQCFLVQTSHMLAVTDYDWSHVFTLCASAEAPYRMICYQGIGRDASGSTVSDVEKTKNICNLGINMTQKEECITGAAKDFVSYFHSDVEAKKLCNTLESQLATACHSVVSSYYATF